MNNIKVLSPHLINLIAAGKVIEKPLNVVKELVENSLDAGSTEISIYLKDCGIKEITVIDNGCGIKDTDLPIALEKHSTSKIEKESDLFKISTLGFRGEALSSIASVSDFYIASNNGETNYFIHKKAGILIEKGVSNIKKGTKIVVKNLFFNTPARLKHLQNQYIELSLTQELIYKLSLANTFVKFSLYNNDKLLYKSSGNNDLLETINECYGPVVAKSLIKFDGSNNFYTIDGYTTNNEIFKSVRNHITIIINGRVIKNYSLIRAVLDSYQSILPVGKYPVTVLKIKCSFDLIDVNVHPSKLEIRFTDELGLKDLITKTIKLSIVQSELLKYQKIDEITKLELNEEKDIQYNVNLEIDTIDSKNEVAINKDNQNDKNETITEDERWDNMFQNSNVKIYEPTIKKEVQVQQTIEEHIDRNFFSSLRYIGQYRVTYLVMEGVDTLYLIDQHAAMERCRYEELLKIFKYDNHESIDLLVPININLTSAEIELLKLKELDLAKIGIIYEPFSTTSIIIRSIPSWIPKNLEVEYLNDIIYAFINNNEANKEIMLNDMIKQISCKSSIKANMAIRDDEVKVLMEKLDKCVMPYTCPHGRPTIIKFTNYEIEKMFKRINQ